MNLFLVILLASALAMTASATEESDDSKGIQGTWLVVTAEIGGKSMTEAFIKSTVLKMENGNYQVTVAGSPDKGAYVIDTKSKPKTIDIAGVEGPNVGKKIPAIYELDGDTLRICYGLGNSPRPTEFKSAPGTQAFFVTYRRKQP